MSSDDIYPSSQAEARNTGAEYYFTGKPCKRGHLAKRKTSQGYCVECHKAYHKQYQQDNKERVLEVRELNKEHSKEYSRLWHATHPKDKTARQQNNAHYHNTHRTKLQYRLKRMLRAAQGRAKRLGRDCILTYEYLLGIFPKDGRCPVTGELFEMGSSHVHPMSPSIDRVDNNLGYVPGNVWFICTKANSLKHTYNLSELRTIQAKDPVLLQQLLVALESFNSAS